MSNASTVRFIKLRKHIIQPEVVSLAKYTA